MRAFIFPGQGSQTVGMGQALSAASPAARAVFEEVDDALGQKLSAIMREGPDDQLTLTENAQPAIMANAIAVLRVLEREGGLALADKADFVAGHSLGEYTALCAAGAFGLADTARLLKLRGQAMQTAVPVGVGAMAALLGADIDKAQALAEAAAEGLEVRESDSFRERIELFGRKITHQALPGRASTRRRSARGSTTGRAPSPRSTPSRSPSCRPRRRSTRRSSARR